MIRFLRVSFLVLLLFPLVFSSFLWKHTVDGRISTNLAFVNVSHTKVVAVATDEGSLFLFRASDGARLREIKLDFAPVWLAGWRGLLVAAGPNSIAVVDPKYGSVKGEKSFGEIDGMTIGPGGIYVVENGRLEKLRDDLTEIWSASAPQPFVRGPFISYWGIAVFSRDKLYLYGDDGSSILDFRMDAPCAAPWASDEGFFSASCSRLFYVFLPDKLKVMYRLTLPGLPVGKLWGNQYGIFVLTSDNILSAFSGVSGKVIWSRRFSKQVSAGVVLFSFENQSALLVGADGRVYIVKAKSGRLLFSFLTSGPVISLATHGGNIIYATLDGEIGAYSLADRGCSIADSLDNLVIGFRPVLAKGTFFSKYNSPKVFVRISSLTGTNSSPWQEAEVKGNEWSFVINPLEYPFGRLRFECKVVDSHGQEHEYTSVELLRSDKLPKNVLVIHAPFFLESGKEIELSVTDEEGNPIDNFTLYLNGRKVAVGHNGAVKFKPSGFGPGALEAQKKWFVPARKFVILSPPLWVLVLLFLIGLAVVGELIVYIFRKQGERWRRRRG